MLKTHLPPSLPPVKQFEKIPFSQKNFLGMQLCRGFSKNMQDRLLESKAYFVVSRKEIDINKVDIN